MKGLGLVPGVCVWGAWRVLGFCESTLSEARWKHIFSFLSAIFLAVPQTGAAGSYHMRQPRRDSRAINKDKTRAKPIK